VYRVEDYLRECLDSILSQDFPDLEVIAVNDASPDGSLAILQDYAERDKRVRIIDLPSSGGLGAARNVGIAAARGEWLWFVDSDDWLAPGAVSAAVRRGRDTGADVVIFDYLRHYPDGRTLPGGRVDILIAAPSVFTVKDYPDVLQLLQIACNKLVRRDVLDRLELRFVDGWYEDTPFSFPLLIGAGALTTLAQPLLNYRQRDGAITRTLSPRHMEVLTQWDQAIERARGLPHSDKGIRAALSQLMVRHSTAVLMKHERIPEALQKPYVAELRRLFKRHHPKGRYKALSRVERIQHLLLPFGSVRLLKAHWWLTARVRPFLHR
jgi:CDP-glycerol glycerophosphotransferase